MCCIPKIAIQFVSAMVLHSFFFSHRNFILLSSKIYSPWVHEYMRNLFCLCRQQLPVVYYTCATNDDDQKWKMKVNVFGSTTAFNTKDIERITQWQRTTSTITATTAQSVSMNFWILLLVWQIIVSEIWFVSHRTKTRTNTYTHAHHQQQKIINIIT